jgi:clan AA aspartic protease (TIGR02281 family)
VAGRSKEADYDRRGSPRRADGRDRIALTTTNDATRRRKAPLSIIILSVVAGIGGVTLLAVGAIVVYLNHFPQYAISSDVVARLDPEAQMLARRLATEPCNRTLASDLVSTLQDKAEYAAIIDFVRKTNDKCGMNEELLADLFFAEKGSSDFVSAERTANQLVGEYPADPNAYGWRAQARERLGDIAGAYADMRIALSLFPDPTVVLLSVYDDIARLAYKAGHPCEAVATLRDYIAFDPEERHTQQLSTVMKNWEQVGGCQTMSGVGTAQLRFDPNATQIVVPVEINGIPGHMIVDTGASRTVLSRQFARRAGIEPIDVRVVTTASGEAVMFGGRADRISVSGARLPGVPVFVQASTRKVLGDGIDGLLGLSFLGNFHVSLNAGVRRLQAPE